MGTKRESMISGEQDASRLVAQVPTSYKGEIRLYLTGGGFFWLGEFGKSAGMGAMHPTARSVVASVEHLPAVRAALEAAELEAIQKGAIRVEHYDAAGLEPHPAVRLVA